MIQFNMNVYLNPTVTKEFWRKRATKNVWFWFAAVLERLNFATKPIKWGWLSAFMQSIGA